MIFPWIPFLKEGEDDELPDHFITLPNYDGFSGTEKTSGGSSLGVNDADTVKALATNAGLAEGAVGSLHVEDNSTSYQNTSGVTAYAIIIIQCEGAGTATRHVKIYSGPTENSTASATLLFEIGSVTTFGILNATGEKLTTPILKIQDNHFLTVENVDDSRAGANNINYDSSVGWVVERG